MAAITALSAAATLMSVLFDINGIKGCNYCGVLGVVLVVLFSYSYACWQTKSKTKITLDLSLELKLTISEGDLFEQKGIICIPVNEYFDTYVGDGVVSEKTLHGIFINKFFKDRIPELEKKVHEQLSNRKFEKHSRRIKGCPEEKYELGTCVDIRDGENTYVLFALTHFDDNDKANVSRAEYTEVTRKLMEHLSNIAEGRPVYMPLFGTGLSRMRRTGQRILLHLVDALDFDDSCIVTGGVNIVIKSLESVDVNLTTLEYVVKNGISKSKE